MGFTAVKCPSCGANVELDNSRESGFCTYCGTEIVQNKVIIEHRGSVTVEGTLTKETLLERAQIMLCDGDFTDADTYFDRVLDTDPHCAAAYCGKLCCKLRTPSDDALRAYPLSIIHEPLYQKAVKYANGADRDHYLSLGHATVENQKQKDDLLFRKALKTIVFRLIFAVITGLLFGIECITIIAGREGDPSRYAAIMLVLCVVVNVFYLAHLSKKELHILKTHNKKLPIVDEPTQRLKNGKLIDKKYIRKQIVCELFFLLLFFIVTLTRM